MAWAVLLLGTCLPNGANADGVFVDRVLLGKGRAAVEATEFPHLTQWQWGWEVRTRSFLLFCATGREDARWIVEQMQEVWSDSARLADHWTDAHRQPEFGTAPVGILVADRSREMHLPLSPGPKEMSRGLDLYLDLGQGPAGLRERLPQIRREAFRAFLRRAGQDRVLPEWTQAGLAAYVSGQEPTRENLRHLDPPQWIANPVPGNLNAETDAQQDQAAAAWVRYLLRGNDARYAPDFFAAMAATVQPRAGGSFYPIDWGRNVERIGPRAPAAHDSPLGRLVTTPAAGRNIGRWLADPELGQPIVKPEPNDATLDDSLQEVVLMLKLAWRFAQPAPTSIRPQVVEFRNGQAQRVWPTTPAGEADVDAREALAAQRRRIESVSDLYQRLTDPTMPPWATIDTDGSLLFSQNRERLAEIFENPQRRCRTIEQDGRQVWETVLASGRTYRAWWEENPENSRRPIVHLHLQPNQPAAAERAALEH